MRERRIRVRYPGRCGLCGADQQIGRAARWDPQTGQLSCVQCPGPAPVAERSGDDPSWWHRLITYHLLVVQRAATVHPAPVAHRDGWTPLALEREELLTGRGSTVALDPALTALFAGAGPHDAVRYGWPLLIVPDSDDRLHVAPLLTLPLRRPSEPDATVAWADDGPPALDQGLLTAEFFPPEMVAAARALGERPAGQGAASVRDLVVDVLAVLGLDAARLDPDALDPHGPGADPHSPEEAAAGVYNAAVAVRTRSDRATQNLLSELRQLRERDDWDATAARWLVHPAASGQAAVGRPGPRAAGAARAPVAVHGLGLNDAQERAVAAAMCEPVVAVTGPPGTGKSQLVAAVVVNQWLAGAPVLVASTNNGAVDVAVRRCARVDPALLIRTGNRLVRGELRARLGQLAGRAAALDSSPPGPPPPVTPPPGAPPALPVAARRRQGVLLRLGERGAAQGELAGLLLQLEVLRTRIWGSPGTPPREPAADELHRLALRAARGRLWRGCRERRLLARAAPSSDSVQVGDVADWAKAQVRADQLIAALLRIGEPEPQDDRADLAAAQADWERAGTRALEGAVADRLRAGAATLARLAQAWPAGRGPRVAAVADALPYAPGWACTALSAHGSFPLTPGLFDLLVMDEAGQCPVAHVLPLAYRARRILVVGDPRQLPPVVTAGAAELAAAAAGAGTTQAQVRSGVVSADRDSAFTAFAARAGTAVLLEEHYRSHPRIARFCNEEFYTGALRILSRVEGFRGPASDGRLTRGVSLVPVPGRTLRAGRGGACNPAEADAVVAWLRDARPAGTVGIVTPFVAQAELLRGRLVDAFGAREVDARGIVVGTVHRFQGDERDTVLFSSVLAVGAAAGTALWLEGERNLINVAVSRARRHFVLFCDEVAIAALPVATLRALVDHARAPEQGPHGGGRPVPGLTGAGQAEAERRLVRTLSGRGIEVRASRVDGHDLRLALDTASGPLDLEVDVALPADPRAARRRQDLLRDEIVEELGVRVVRVPAWRCLLDPAAIADRLEAALRLAEVGAPAPPRRSA